MRIYEVLHGLTIDIEQYQFTNFRILKGRYTKMYQIRFKDTEKKETYIVLFKKDKNSVWITKFIKSKKVSDYSLLIFKGRKGNRTPIFKENWEDILFVIIETCFKGSKKERVRYLFQEILVKELYK